MFVELKLELPEIEAIRRDIEREFLTRKIRSVDVKSMKGFTKNRTKKEVEDLLLGSKLESVERYGMNLVLRFDNGNLLFLALGDNGRLSKGAKDFDGDLVLVIDFTQGGPLQLSDTDTSSTMAVIAADDLEQFVFDPEVTGIDLQAEPLSWIDFGRIVMKQEQPLKLLLTDENVFIGIGDIYSNEILFDAGLRYDRPSNKLSTQEIRRLYRSTVGVLHEASKSGGTSLEERPFYNLLGEPGEYAEQLNVFGKDGELSPRSREPINKTKFKGQVVYYCNTQV